MIKKTFVTLHYEMQYKVDKRIRTMFVWNNNLSCAYAEIVMKRAVLDTEIMLRDRLGLGYSI